MSRQRVARPMRTAGLQGCHRRRLGRGLTRRDPQAAPAPDLVERAYTTDRPEQLWVADITYIPTRSGWLYLAVALDVWSRRVVGWAMADHLRTELVVDALDMAIWHRRPAAGLVHHSDQGCQYTSLAFGRRCREAGITPSMGSVGDCFDNAMAESFFAHTRMRAPGPPPLPDPDRGPGGRIRLPGRLLQPSPAALRPGPAQPDQLRKEPPARMLLNLALTHPPDRGNSNHVCPLWVCVAA